jgi:glutamate-1-semialdehyde aminotransferase
MTIVSPTSIIRNALNTRADVALSAVETRSCHSWKMSLDRANVLPQIENFAGGPPFQLYLRDGIGARISDVDGNWFIDLSMGLGAQILGHGVQAVQDAVLAQATRGWQDGLANDGEIALARHIQTASAANERVVFCNSSAEATVTAIRAARAFAGRSAIGVFAGSLHGMHPPGLAENDLSVGSPSPTGAAPAPAEVSGLFGRPWGRAAHRSNDLPAKAAEPGAELIYGDASAFEQIRRGRHHLAAVIVEPVRARDPGFEHADWLRGLAQVCREAGVLLILDERHTGFRLAFGGAQERLGLFADLVVYGENIGGGLPLGAVAGRADVLSEFARRESVARDARPTGGNILSLAAGAATLEHLAARRATLYPALEEKGRLLAESFNKFAESSGLPAKMRAGGSIFRMCFAHAAAETAFYTIVLSKGLLMHPSRLGFLSIAHTMDDIAYIGQIFRDALTDVRDDGRFEPKG